MNNFKIFLLTLYSDPYVSLIDHNLSFILYPEMFVIWIILRYIYPTMLFYIKQ